MSAIRNPNLENDSCGDIFIQPAAMDAAVKTFNDCAELLETAGNDLVGAIETHLNPWKSVTNKPIFIESLESIVLSMNMLVDALQQEGTSIMTYKEERAQA
ncbi:MAG: hypothetical protein FWG40_11355 [Peptococcaceae bacterium]|nr:hypothetical protein [Peptococcaceae bacterium]